MACQRSTDLTTIANPWNNQDPENITIPCNVKVCRICFAKDGKMYSITDSKDLNEAYETLTGILTEDEEHLPRYLCTECGDRLMNCARFRRRSLQAHLVLLDMVKRHGRITVELISSLLDNHSDSDPVENPNDDRFDFDDEELEEVNKVTDSRIDMSLESNDIIENSIDMKSEVDCVSDNSINSEGRTNDMIDKVETENDSNNGCNAGSINVKVEAIAENDMIGQDDLNVRSFDFKKNVDDNTNNGINQDVNDEVISNKILACSERLNDTVNVIKIENSDVTNEGSSEVDKSTSNDMEQHSFESVGEDVQCSLGTQVVRSKRPKRVTSQTLNQMKNINQKEAENEDEKLYSCDICKKSFKYKCRLKSHLKSHNSYEKPFSCEICKKAFRQKLQLKLHSIIHLSEVPYTCDICRKVFIDKRRFRLHMVIHSDEKPYPCCVCKKAFGHKYALQSHLQTHSNKKLFKCDVCKRGFGNKGALHSHLKIHCSEKPYSCDICKKAFSQKHHVETHLKIHSDNKPYSCNVCEKSFKLQSTLTAHLTVHSGAKPYSCEVCKKAFSHKQQLESHLSKHSDEKPFSCYVCKKNV